MRLLGVAAALLLLAACGGGSQSSTGRVSDLSGRLCLQTTREDGTCFAATDEQLAQLQLGNCVRVGYRGGAGVAPTADEVQVVPPPCFAGTG